MSATSEGENVDKETLNVKEDEAVLSVTPLRVGVRVKPPTVTLLYRSVEGQRRLRMMPVRGLAAYGPVAVQVAQLRLRHTNYLKKVPDLKLEKLLRLLQEVSCGRSLKEAVEALDKEYTVDPCQDLNKLSDADIQKKKKIMDSSFVQHQVLPSDPDYEYDKRVEFGEEGDVAGWDSEDDFWN